MPDSTAPIPLPFPLAAEPFALGYQNIEDLAEALNTWFTSSALLIRETNQATVSGAAEAIGWSATESELGADFELDSSGGPDANDIFRYTGPDRYFAWRYGAQFDGAASVSTVQGLFRRDTTAVANGSDDYVWSKQPFPYLEGSGVVFMSTGSEWNLVVQQDTGTNRNVLAQLTLKGL